MKTLWRTCLAIVATSLMMSAWAGDDSGGSHKQRWKDCMARQKAQNSAVSEDDAKAACKTEMKLKGGHPGRDTPDQTTPTTKGDPAPQTGDKNNPPQ